MKRKTPEKTPDEIVDDISKVCKYFKSICPHRHEINREEFKMIHRYIKQYPLRLVLQCVEIAAFKYLDDDSDDEDYTNAFEKIGGILYNKTRDY